MTQKRIILTLEFTDALTGELIKGNMSQEVWDTMVVATEKLLADIAKENGLKKDLP